MLSQKNKPSYRWALEFSVVAIAVTLALHHPTVHAQSPQTDWNTYTNSTLGFSLRYPPSLEAVVWELDNSAREMGWKLVLNFVTREIDPERDYLGHVTALHIIVKEANGPTSPNLDVDFLQHRNGFHEMEVGGRFAARSIGCGRAACHWSVDVPGSRQLTINTGDPDESAKPGPEDARYPLLSMIKSIAFDRTFPK